MWLKSTWWPLFSFCFIKSKIMIHYDLVFTLYSKRWHLCFLRVILGMVRVPYSWATLSKSHPEHHSLNTWASALCALLLAAESDSMEPIHCFTPIQNLLALSLSGYTSSITLLPFFSYYLWWCHRITPLKKCGCVFYPKNVKETQGGVGHSHGNQVFWYRQGYQAKPNAICIQIAQLIPCCYDNGTQLPEFIWKWNTKRKQPVRRVIDKIPFSFIMRMLQTPWWLAFHWIPISMQYLQENKSYIYDRN